MIIKKILFSLDASKITGTDKIPAKFLMDGAELLALVLRNIMNLLIKLLIFPVECNSCNFYEIFKNTFFTELLQATASAVHSLQSPV